MAAPLPVAPHALHPLADALESGVPGAGVARAWHVLLQRVSKNEQDPALRTANVRSAFLAPPEAPTAALWQRLLQCYLQAERGERKYFGKVILGCCEELPDVAMPAMVDELRSSLVAAKGQTALLPTLVHLLEQQPLASLADAVMPELATMLASAVPHLSHSLISGEPVSDVHLHAAVKVYIALLQRMPEKMLCDGCSSLADTLCCEFASWVSQVLLSRDVLMLATFALVATSVALAPRDADSVRVVCRALFSRKWDGPETPSWLAHLPPMDSGLAELLSGDLEAAPPASVAATTPADVAPHLRLLASCRALVSALSSSDVAARPVEYTDMLSAAAATEVGSGTLLRRVLWPVALAYAAATVPDEIRHVAVGLLPMILAAAKNAAAASDEPVLARSMDAAVVDRLLGFVFAAWEDPAPFVRSTAQSAFEELMLLSQATADGQERCRDIAYRLLNLDWRVKGRYGLLAKLAKTLGADSLLDMHPQLKSEMLLCSRIGVLFQTAGNIYEILLRNDRRLFVHVAVGSSSAGAPPVATPNAAAIWATEWMPTLMTMLQSPHGELRAQASHVWLPTTLRVLPTALDVLLDALDDDSAAGDTLQPYVMVLAAAKTVGLLSAADMSEALEGAGRVSLRRVRAALHHASLDLRREALKLVCSSAHVSAVSSCELVLLRECLPLLMPLSSTAFRQEIVIQVRALVVRLRQAWVSETGHVHRADQRVAVSLRKDAPQPVLEAAQTELDAHTAALDQATAAFAGTVRWLHDLCLASLTPGSNFQRRSVALQLLTELTTLVLDGGSGALALADGAAADATDALPASLRRLFHNDWRDVVRLLGDPQERIRSLAEALLRRPGLRLPADACQRLWADGLVLCSRHRVKDTECGAAHIAAAAVALVQRAVGARAGPNVVASGESDSSVTLASGEPDRSSATTALDLCRDLLRRLREQMAAAEANPLVAARTAPAHGLTLAIQRALESIGPGADDIASASAAAGVGGTGGPIATSIKAALAGRPHAPPLDAAWLALLEELLDTVDALTEIGLRVLTLPVAAEGGDAAGEGERSMPSSADLDLHVADLVRAAGGVGDEDECALLHNFAWLVLRNASTLLGRVLCAGVPRKSRHRLPAARLTAAEHLFTRVLRSCRHRGVLEAYAGAMAVACGHFVDCKASDVAKLPAQWLEAHLSRLEAEAADSSAESPSVTRRSAGLPFIVLSLLRHRKRAAQLPGCVSRLIALAQHPVDVTSDERVDPRQVHAFNILKAIVADKLVGAEMHSFLSRCMILALGAFSSPRWAIRNASMQLYCASMQRMLGGQRVREGLPGGTGGMTTSTFLSRFPDVFEHIVATLAARVAASERAGSTLLSAGVLVHPEVYPTLTLLSKLRAVDRLSAADEAVLKPALALLEHLAGSPVLPVRGLAARTTLALVSQAAAPEHALMLLERAAAAGLQLGQNVLHGCLLRITLLLRGGAAARLDNATLATALTALDPLRTTPVNPCALTRAAVLDVYAAAAAGGRGAAVSAVVSHAACQHAAAVAALPSPCGANTPTDMGRDAEESAAVALWIHHEAWPSWCGQREAGADTAALKLLHALLRAPSVDVRIAAAAHVTACVEGNEDAGAVAALAQHGAEEEQEEEEDSADKSAAHNADVGSVELGGGSTTTATLTLRAAHRYALQCHLWTTLTDSTQAAPTAATATPLRHEQEQSASQQAVAVALLALKDAAVSHVTGISSSASASADPPLPVPLWQAAAAWCIAATRPHQRNARLREVAFVLLGELLGRAPDATDTALQRHTAVWLAQAETWASDEASAAEQGAAVRSVALAVQSTAAGLCNIAVVLDAAARLRLWRCVIFFLCSEDEEPRQMAARAATGLAASTGADAPPGPLPAEEALRLAFACLAALALDTEHAVATAVVELLFNFLVEPAVAAGSAGAAPSFDGVRQSVLFEREARNPYLEGDKLAQLAFASLTALCTHGPANPQLRLLPTHDAAWVERLPAGVSPVLVALAHRLGPALARQLVTDVAAAHRADAQAPAAIISRVDVADVSTDETGITGPCDSAAVAQLVLQTRALALCLYVHELNAAHVAGGLVPWARVPGVEAVPHVPVLLSLFQWWAADATATGPPSALSLAMALPLRALQAAHADPPHPDTRLHAAILALGIMLVARAHAEDKAWWETAAARSDGEREGEEEEEESGGEEEEAEALEGVTGAVGAGEEDVEEDSSVEGDDGELLEAGPWPSAVALTSFPPNFLCQKASF